MDGDIQEVESLYAAWQILQDWLGRGWVKNCAERFVQQRLAADCLQPTLLRRSGLRQQLKASVRQRV